MSKVLLLVRHGEAAAPKPGGFLGSTDVPLSDLGRRQAARLAARMAPLAGARFLASPLCRASETARLALEPAGTVAESAEDLREIDFGRWEGMRFDEIAEADPDTVALWAEYSPEFRFPEGEGLLDFQARVQGIARRIAREEAETVVVFAHGGVIRALICHYLGLEPQNYLLFDVRPASVTSLRLFGDNGVLTGLSDVCHLEGL